MVHGRNPPRALPVHGSVVGCGRGVTEARTILRATRSHGQDCVCLTRWARSCRCTVRPLFHPLFLSSVVLGKGAWPEMAKVPRPMQATAGKRCRFAFDNERDVL